MQFQSRDAIDIDTSPERAWATMVDVEGWPRWTPRPGGTSGRRRKG